MSIYGPIYISQFGLITLCILCHQEALVSSFPPSKEENIRAWCAFPIQDMPEVVKKKVTCNNDSLIVQRVGYLLGNYSKQIHTQTRVQNEYRIYSINRAGRLLNFWTLRVGAYSRLGAY